jgi:hypothetical protein
LRSTTHAEEIAGDIPVPKLVGSWLRVRPHFWLSTPGHITETHRDGHHNPLVQVIGTKKLTLFSPIFTHALYSHDATAHSVDTVASTWTTPTRIGSRSRELAPTEVTLNAGETLFLPVYWWHRVETCAVSVSVNFWWAPPLNLSLHPQLPLVGTPEAIFEAIHALADLGSFPSEFDVAEYLWSEGFHLVSAAYLHHCIALLLAAKNPEAVDGQHSQGLVRAAKRLTVSGILSEDEFQTIRSILRSCRQAVELLAKRRGASPRHGIADMVPLVTQARRLAARLRCAKHFRPSRWVAHPSL